MAPAHAPTAASICHRSAHGLRDVKAGRNVKGGGYYTWTIEDVKQFMDRHKVGTRAHLALALLLFTGARRQDMVTFGKQHIPRKPTCRSEIA